MCILQALILEFDAAMVLISTAEGADVAIVLIYVQVAWYRPLGFGS